LHRLCHRSRAMPRKGPQPRQGVLQAAFGLHARLGGPQGSARIVYRLRIRRESLVNRRVDGVLATTVHLDLAGVLTLRELTASPGAGSLVGRGHPRRLPSELWLANRIRAAWLHRAAGTAVSGRRSWPVGDGGWRGGPTLPGLFSGTVEAIA